MKESYYEKMRELKIDDSIKPIIGELWDKGYETIFSCQGRGREKLTHDPESYLTIIEGSGNGWFTDDMAKKYDFVVKKILPAQIIRSHNLPARIEYRGVLKNLDKGFRRITNPLKRLLIKQEHKRLNFIIL